MKVRVKTGETTKKNTMRKFNYIDPLEVHYGSLLQSDLDMDVEVKRVTGISGLMQLLTYLDEKNQKDSPVYLFTHKEEDEINNPSEIIITQNIKAVFDFIYSSQKYFVENRITVFFLQEYATWEGAYEVACMMREVLPNGRD